MRHLLYYIIFNEQKTFTDDDRSYLILNCIQIIHILVVHVVFFYCAHFEISFKRYLMIYLYIAKRNCL